MNQNPNQGGQAPGNRPPPPPPRQPTPGGQAQPAQPTYIPPQPQQQPQYPQQHPPLGYPQGVPPQPPPGQYDPYAPQPQGQYYSQPGQYYAPPRQGLPMAVWLAIGGGVLALIAVAIVVIILVTNKPGVGGGSSAADTVKAYYSLLGSHDYNGAHNLLSPSASAANSVDQLQKGVEDAEAQSGAKFQSVDVTNIQETGDSATATATLHITNGTARPPLQVSLVKVNNKWLIDSVQ